MVKKCSAKERKYALVSYSNLQTNINTALKHLKTSNPWECMKRKRTSNSKEAAVFNDQYSKTKAVATSGNVLCAKMLN